MVLDHTVHTRQLSIQQILDVRRTLELRTASLAAVRRTDQEAEVILKIAHRMQDAILDSNAVMELDISLHEAIAAASRNPLYAMIVGSFRVITRQTWHIGWVSRQTEANRMANIECHIRLAQAIAAQDALKAEATMIEHFESAISVLVRAGVS
jgi:DNA-binding FadR family transcriptional regulator